MLLENLFCLPLSVFPVFGIEREQRIPLFSHTTKQYPQGHGIPLPCRLSSIAVSNIVHTSISHTSLLGLCQVRKVGIILVSSLLKGEGIMTRLRVKEVAQAKGFTMA